MYVLGVNTGTSVDGVDLALVKWSLSPNQSIGFKIIKEESYAFDPEIKLGIEKLINKQEGHLEEISDLNFAYSEFIAMLIKKFSTIEVKQLALAGEAPSKQQAESIPIDLIGMHGQTIYHGDKSTWQLGDGSIIAKLSGIDTISNFRPADMAYGGAGAPLISLLDDIIVRQAGLNIAALNIGGIANITVMPDKEDTFAYDIGPGNTLIDNLMKKLYHRDFDKDGEIAKRGKVDHVFIEKLIGSTEYFKQDLPKTTGRELFNDKYADKFLDLGKKENIISTVSYFTVELIKHELNKYKLDKVYISGGGSKNHFLMSQLQDALPDMSFASHTELNIDDQYKEALLFSLLAFTSFNKIPNNLPCSTGASKATILGSISYSN